MRQMAYDSFEKRNEKKLKPGQPGELKQMRGRSLCLPVEVLQMVILVYGVLRDYIVGFSTNDEYNSLIANGKEQ